MPPKQHPKSVYWHIRGQDASGKYFKSTGIAIEFWGKKQKPAPESVWAYERQFLSDRALARATGGNPSHSAADAPLTMDTLEAFFWQGKRAKGLSEDMVRTYRNNWKQLRRHLPTLEDCNSRAKIEAYVLARQKDKAWGGKSFVTIPTILKELTVLRFAWKECVEEGVPLPHLPAEARNVATDEHVPHKGLEGTAYGIGTLMAIYRQITKRRNQDKFYLAMTTGLRWKELHRLHMVTHLEILNTDGVAAYFLLPREATKKKRERYVGLVPEAFGCWKRLAPFDYGDSRKALDVARMRVGLPQPITLRDLRASFATAARDNGATQAGLDSVMGHKLPYVAAEYQKSTPQRAIEVAQAIGRWLAQGKKCGQSVDLAKIIALRA